MLKMWNCNLMTGEWHGLTGEELFCDLNGLPTVEVVCICAPYDVVALAQSTPSHCVLGQRLEGELAAVAFLEYVPRCPQKERGRGGLTCKELLMLLLTLSICVCFFK